MSGQASELSPTNASVPLGSILGPLVFSIFIDDLVDVYENPLYLYVCVVLLSMQNNISFTVHMIQHTDQTPDIFHIDVPVEDDHSPLFFPIQYK